MLNPQEAHFAAATAIGVLIGALYALPVAAHFGDPLANVASYHSQQWQGGWLFGFPFYAIVKGTWHYPAPWTNLALSFSWILLVLSAVVMMIKSPEFRAYCRLHLVEAAFLVPYLWCLFTYNYPHWARGNFLASQFRPFHLFCSHSVAGSPRTDASSGVSQPRLLCSLPARRWESPTLCRCCKGRSVDAEPFCVVWSDLWLTFLSKSLTSI